MSSYQSEVATEFLESIQELRNRLGNMPDDALIKARPDLISILGSFSNWLQVQSRTGAEAYKLHTEFDSTLMHHQDRKTWIFQLENLEFEIRSSLKSA